MATTVNSIGLILDIVGGLILLKFGLPARIDPEGRIYRIVSQVDEDEIKRARTYKILSNIGVLLLISGFFSSACQQLCTVTAYYK